MIIGNDTVHIFFAGCAVTYAGIMKMEAAKSGVPFDELNWTQEGIAEIAWDIADAMMAEREKRYGKAKDSKEDEGEEGKDSNEG